MKKGKSVDMNPRGVIIEAKRLFVLPRDDTRRDHMITWHLQTKPIETVPFRKATKRLHFRFRHRKDRTDASVVDEKAATCGRSWALSFSIMSTDLRITAKLLITPPTNLRTGQGRLLCGRTMLDDLWRTRRLFLFRWRTAKGRNGRVKGGVEKHQQIIFEQSMLETLEMPSGKKQWAKSASMSPNSHNRKQKAC